MFLHLDGQFVFPRMLALRLADEHDAVAVRVANVDALVNRFTLL